MVSRGHSPEPDGHLPRRLSVAKLPLGGRPLHHASHGPPPRFAGEDQAAFRTTPANRSRAASSVASRLAKQKRTTFLTAPSA